jgi:ribosomal protein L3 glutamine methyltransferase
MVAVESDFDCAWRRSPLECRQIQQVNIMKDPSAQLHSIRDFVRWGVSQFHAAELGFYQGMPSALDEAVYLCLAALHLPPDFSAAYFDCVLTQDEKQRVYEFYRQRVEARKPAAYITGEAWFAGMNFHVDERVLIPRSPIAELIEQRFAPWVDESEVRQVLDLCTGSGCIAIACADALPNAQVVACDISVDALAVAEDNRRLHGMEDRVELVQSDLFVDVPEREYDIIVSNPPYVSSQEVSSLPAEFDYEPKAIALDAGEDGLDLVIPMLQSARDFMSAEGILVIEVGYTRPALEACFPNVPFTWLEFERGGEGVFLLTAEQLEMCQPDFDNA